MRARTKVVQRTDDLLLQIVFIVLTLLSLAPASEGGAYRNLCGASSDLSELYEDDTIMFTSHDSYGGAQKYPKNFICTYKFTLGDTCERMSVSCPKINVKGNAKRNCIGDHIVIDRGQGTNERICGQGSKNFTSTAPLTVITFKSNRRRQAPGFECYARCSKGAKVEEEETTTPPTMNTTELMNHERRECYCGKKLRAHKIVGGEATDANEYPWQVGLVEKGKTKPFCGGSLISSKHVLSAGHCFQYKYRNPSSFVAVLGVHDVTGGEPAAVESRISSILIHPSYDSTTLNYDYTILTLETEIDLTLVKNKHIQPVCLPSEPHVGGERCVATGWGTLSSGGNQPNVLQEVEVGTISREDCQDYLIYDEITDVMMCAIEKDKDTCQGDSGGPLVRNNGGSFEQVGITSWGYGCAEAGHPGVYADVFALAESWIKPNIADAAACDRKT